MLLARERVRGRVRVEGIVQGVGFRPFVHALATREGLTGFVANDPGGVSIEVEGRQASVAAFLARLEPEAPPLVVIERVQHEWIPVRGEVDFAIVASQTVGERATPVSPDVATCPDCLREMFDPGDRRWHYAFTNCTNCGPRFTIVRDVPYDRVATTMAGFAMCTDCASEYRDPSDRRFHAEPISCPACGPRLSLLDGAGRALPGDPVRSAVALLAAGAILAIKGLGGYHLAAIADHEKTVAMLRARKHREDKPFAVMAADLVAARELAEIGALEERILGGARRPIVLCRRRPAAALAMAVAPGNRFIGLMLPYTPLHHLIGRGLGKPVVLTSGNVSEEPIAYRDEDAFARLGGIADFFLTHDRPIHVRTDDSVVRVTRARETPVRRARGYAPQPILLPWPSPRHILACGGELKNTFCLVRGRHAFLSPHVGDLENFETLRAFTDGIAHCSRIFDIAPDVVAHDLHPEYRSTKHALEMEGVERIAVQHHHAHVAACLGDNGVEGPVIGVAFDGLGYGVDGTLWGGEFLIADLTGFERVGYLEPVPMPGGTQAIREPWRMAAVYLDRAYAGEPPLNLEVAARNRRAWPMVIRLARTGVHAPLTSSVGRLFDALAAILGVRDTLHYEGQAAVELEQRADPHERGAYSAAFNMTAPHVLQGADLVRAAVDDLSVGVAPEIVAARFHNGVARAVVAVASVIRSHSGLDTVALSGGVFQNTLLIERTADGLEQAGFRVLTHHRVPANDGGISFGQAVVAATQVRRSIMNSGA